MRRRGIGPALLALAILIGSGGLVLHQVRADPVLRVVPLTQFPAGVTINARAGRAYIATGVGDNAAIQADSRLIVLDTRSGATMRDLDTGLAALPVVADSVLGHLFALYDWGTTSSVLMLDARSGDTLGTASVNRYTAAMVLDTQTHRLFLASRSWSGSGSQASVTRIDTHSGAVLGIVPLPGDPAEMVLDAQAQRVFVDSNVPRGDPFNPTGFAESVSTFDAASGQLVRNVPVGALSGRNWVSVSLIAGPQVGRLFVLNPNTSSVSTIEAHSGALVRSVTLHSQPTSAILAEATAHLFVLSRQGVSVLDAKSGELWRTVTLDTEGGFGDLALNRQQTRLFIAGKQSVSVLDTTSGRLLQRVPLASGLRFMVLDARANRVFVATAGGLRLLDATSGQLLPMHGRTVPTQIIAVDEQRGRVYAGTASGVSVLDAPSGALLREITLSVAPSMLAVDERSGRVVALTTPGISTRQTDLWRLVPCWLRARLPFAPPATPPGLTRGSIVLIDPGA